MNQLIAITGRHKCYHCGDWKYPESFFYTRYHGRRPMRSMQCLDCKPHPETLSEFQKLQQRYYQLRELLADMHPVGGKLRAEKWERSIITHNPDPYDIPGIQKFIELITAEIRSVATPWRYEDIKHLLDK